MLKFLTILLALSPMVMGQQAGTMTAEVHPPVTWHRCQKGGHCTAVHGSVTMDASWRWLHNAQGQNCYNNNKWDPTSCPDELTCAKNCAYDGVQYKSYLNTHGDSLNMTSGRLYLMASESKYEMFHLLGQEFTFDVDMSKLACGMNGALYLVAMEADGGAGRHPTNKAGAKFGTGYCDSQCARGMSFIEGKANFGKGDPGACCGEMDIWEANAMASALTIHPCTKNGYHVCTGDGCGGGSGPHRYTGTCDPDGCEHNIYRMSGGSFYGPGKTVDTNKVFTVVTQFITSDGTPHGHLTEIRRFYVQHGKVIPNSMSIVSGVSGNSITEKWCESKTKVIHDSDSAIKHGGVKQMGENLRGGMVLTFALWGGQGMEWLDAVNVPGHSEIPRGPCPATIPADQVPKNVKNAYITFSNMKVGPINSTFHHAH